MDNWAPRILVCRSARIGEGKRLGEHVVVHDVDEVSVEAEHDFARRAGSAPIFRRSCARESMSAPRSVSIAFRSNPFEPVQWTSFITTNCGPIPRRLLTGRGGLRPRVAVCRRVCLQAQLVVLNSTASKD